MDDELFILRVRDNEAIYDPSHKHHRHKRVLASIWRRLGGEFGFPSDVLKEKWDILLLKYTRIRKQERKKPSGFGPKLKPRWPYFDLMSFMDDYIEPEDTGPSEQQQCSYQLICTSDEPKCELGYIHGGQIGCSTMTTNTYELVTNRNQQSNFKIKKSSTEYNIGDHYWPGLNGTENDDNDPDKLFLLSLLPCVKRLKPIDNLEFKVHTLAFFTKKLFS